jgi:hypothetical protein
MDLHGLRNKHSSLCSAAWRKDLDELSRNLYLTTEDIAFFSHRCTDQNLGSVFDRFQCEMLDIKNALTIGTRVGANG